MFDQPTADAALNPALEVPLRVCVVGSGTRFLSGISYYTNRLVHALAERHRLSVILIRQLLPTRFYPGRTRVGERLVEFAYPARVVAFDGIDWFWGKSMPRALCFLRRERPQIVVLQWWSGTVAHTYVLLVIAARLLGARVVMEFHEVQDTGELELAAARRYVAAVAPLLVRLCHGYVVHNEFDRGELEAAYGLGDKPVATIPHGPYGQQSAPTNSAAPPSSGAEVNLLYFGVIRPFKGVDDLLRAFNALGAAEAARFHLTVVGETWEGFNLPSELIAESPYPERITFINRYVEDSEVACFFSAADAVVLPYHRSSASGPLHIAMAQGLPVIVSAVGGLIEATEGYEGAILIPPHEPDALMAAFLEVAELKGRTFEDVHSWTRTLERYDELFARVRA